jgi:hypothetical protein
VSERIIMGVRGRFTASHVCMEAEPHEHPYEVEAKFAVAHRTDMRCHRAALQHVLAGWHGKRLSPQLEWAEDIARAVYTLCNCVAVEVEHDDIVAYWPPPEPHG